MSRWHWLFLTFFLGTAAHAVPERFFNLEAELPLSWNCNREGVDFVCLNQNDEGEKSAAIVITVREKGPQDSFVFFKDQLSRPRSLEFQGLPMSSQVREVKEREINQQMWIEGIHFGSEIQGYITHYLVSTDGYTSVLISINIHQGEHDLIYASLAPFLSSLRILPSEKKLKDTGEAPVPGTVAKEFGTFKKSGSKDLVQVMGMRFKKIHLIAAGAGLFAILLLGYAVLSD